MTQDELKKLVFYDRETGKFFRLPKNNEIGYPMTGGYIRFRLNGRVYIAHRMAWLYETGVMPTQHIDHINGNVADNRFSNLREANFSENAQNIHKKFKGYNFDKRTGKYRAKIMKNKKTIMIGYFDSENEAHEAYLAKKREIHPYFCN